MVLHALQDTSVHFKTTTSAVVAEVFAAALVAPNMPHWFKKFAPDLRTKLINSVSERFILPHHDRMESYMKGMFQSKEKKAKWEEAHEVGKEATARLMGEEAVNMAISFPGTLASSYIINKAVTKYAMKSDLGTGQFMLGALGEGAVHLGLIVGGPKLFPNQMASLKSWTCKTLQKMGVDQDRAESISQNFVYFSLSDMVGFGANLAIQNLMASKSSSPRL